MRGFVILSEAAAEAKNLYVQSPKRCFASLSMTFHTPFSAISAVFVVI
jgi:hypothetical protein